MTPRPLTHDEAFAVARLRRRRSTLQTLKSARAWLPGAPRDGPTRSVDLVALERLGYVERWELGGTWLWRATDEPPRFDRPHWRCEQEFGDLGGLWRVVVNVEPGHPELIASFRIPPRAMGDAYLERDELYEALRFCEREIASAIALRAAGDACECGSCEPGAGKPTGIREDAERGIASDTFDARGKLVPHFPVDARTTDEERAGRGERGVFVVRDPVSPNDFLGRPRMFAMVDRLGVVDRVVAVLHGSSAIVARRPDLRSIELPEAPAHPVGKGWTYRGGVFYSPAIENGFGAGERQVKAKGSDQ